MHNPKIFRIFSTHDKTDARHGAISKSADFNRCVKLRANLDHSVLIYIKSRGHLLSARAGYAAMTVLDKDDISLAAGNTNSKKEIYINLRYIIEILFIVSISQQIICRFGIVLKHDIERQVIEKT